MKPLMTATALTLTLGMAAAPGAMAAQGDSVPEERRTYQNKVERQMNLYEEKMETMEVDPEVRSSWVKANQNWNSVTDEQVENWPEARDRFETSWTGFLNDFEAAQKQGLASNAAVPEERRTFQQSTAYDLARYDAIMVERSPNENVREAYRQARRDWHAMLNADSNSWDDARETYLESWRDFVGTWEQHDMSG